MNRVILLLLLVTAGSCSKPQTAAQPENTPAAAAVPTPIDKPKRHLSLDDALEWRDMYGDLLGKPREAAIERFGPGFRESPPGLLSWDSGPKTRDRSIAVAILGHGAEARIGAVKVFAKDDEQIDPVELIKRAQLFDFDTGTYRDSVTNYWLAATKDGRNSYQFEIGESRVTFHAMEFTHPELEKGPARTH